VVLETTFTDLASSLQRLKDACGALQLTVQEDRPPADAVPVERLGDAVDDTVGWLEEARAAATDAERAVAHPVDDYRAREALTRCQQRWMRASRQYTSEIASYDRLTALARFCDGRDGEWRAWMREVIRAAERCHGPLEEVHIALFTCWQVLAERLAAGGLQIHNTTVGPNVRGMAVPSQRKRTLS